MSDQKNRQSLLLPILFPVAILVLIGAVLFGFSRILLHVTPNAATVVALITAAGIFTIASLVASRERLSGTALFPMIVAVAGVALAAGGLALVASPKVEGTAVEAQTVLLGAPINAAVEGFKPTTLTFKADAPTNLQFNDEDPTAPHNVVIFAGKDATGKQVFEGALVNGPKQVTYQVPALPAGDYFFHCAVHPTTMMGNITVSASGGGGSGGGTGTGPLTIAASNLTFSTDALSIPADTATTLTFDNQDAGVPHNFSIYADNAYTDNLFKGDLVTGPATQEYQLPALAAGTYYFRCDVHPTTMTGTLTVGAGSASGGGSSGSASPSGSTASSASPSG
jgi:plastocyanin